MNGRLPGRGGFPACAENCQDRVGVKAVATLITQLGGVTVWRKILFSFGMKGESC